MIELSKTQKKIARQLIELEFQRECKSLLHSHVETTHGQNTQKHAIFF